MTRAAWQAIAIFLVTRALILIAYSPYIPDYPIFHQLAEQGFAPGMRAYRDFGFSYPPLMLPFLYLPYVFGKSVEAYGLALKLEMLAVDALTFWTAWRLARERLGFDERQLVALAVFSSALALGQGFCLYDRFDLLVGLALVVPAFFVGREGRASRVATYAPGLLGILVKLVPAFWLVPTIVMENRGRCRTVVRDAALVFGIPAALLAAYDVFYAGGGLSSMLAGHGARGIQLESTWASPLLVLNAVAQSHTLHFVSNYGAQHLTGPMLPDSYVTASKWVGFGLLGALLAWLAVRLSKWPKADPLTYLEVALLVALAVMATQRVLSPQFFSWPLYGLSLLVVARRDFRLGVGVLILYFLTLVNYRWGFVRLFEPGSVAPFVLAARNGLLIVIGGKLLCGYRIRV